MEVIKKPRGRPRKIVNEDEPIKKPPKILNDDEPIKKPRGRPRKIVNDDEPIKKPPKILNDDEPIKKSRGRPRKIVNEDDKPIKKSRKIVNEDDKPIKKSPKIAKEDDKPIKKSPKIAKEDDKPIKKSPKIAENIRIKNYEKIKNLLKDIGELRVDGENKIYIGDIRIIKKIGSDSKNGLILLGELNNFKIALKITRYNPKKTNELDTFKVVSNAVVNNNINNFPLLYDYKTYEPMRNVDKFPKIFHKFLKNPYIIYFNELADGDLKQFLNDNYNNDELIINALYQSLMSLVNFYRITGKFHNDSHYGNFLYHKIPLSNKDFEYEFKDKKVKIKNLGYMFVIWDLEKASEFNKHKYRINADIFKLLMGFVNEDDKLKGYMSPTKPYGKKVKDIVNDLFKNLIINDKASFNELGYSPKKIQELISIIFEKII